MNVNVLLNFFPLTSLTIRPSSVVVAVCVCTITSLILVAICLKSHKLLIFPTLYRLVATVSAVSIAAPGTQKKKVSNTTWENYSMAHYYMRSTWVRLYAEWKSIALTIQEQPMAVKWETRGTELPWIPHKFSTVPQTGYRQNLQHWSCTLDV